MFPTPFVFKVMVNMAKQLVVLCCFLCSVLAAAAAAVSVQVSLLSAMETFLKEIY